MADELKVRVKNWLNKHGYPLEMEVASIARDAGFEVSQSECYVDPETGLSREIDLILYKSNFSQGEGSVFLSYRLLVECKSSKDKPWLLFATPNVNDDSEQDKFISSYRLEESYFGQDCIKRYIQRLIFTGEEFSIYPNLDSEPWLGFGVTQAFSEAQDTPFKAIMSATKAALYYASRANQLEIVLPDFELFFPIVVIDVPLYAVFHNSESNELDMVEIEVGNILWKHHMAGRSRHGVYLVTKSALPTFLARCHQCAEWLLRQDEMGLNQIYQEVSSKK